METKPGGFRGRRNEDTRAATQRSVEVRQAKALERKLIAAQALLVEKGATVTWPTTNSSES